MTNVKNFLRLFCSYLFVNILLASNDYTICKFVAPVEKDHFYIPKWGYTSIAHWGEQEYTGFDWCSGLMIEDRFALVSTHCLLRRRCIRNPITMRFSTCTNENPTSFDILQSPENFESNITKEVKKVIEIFVHPKWFDGKHTYDPTYGLALLRAERIFSPKYQNYDWVTYPKNTFYFDTSEWSYCTLLYTTSSYCTRTYTNELRKNKYILRSGKPMMALKAVKIVPVERINRVQLCDDEVKKYADAGLVFDKNMLICAKAVDFKAGHCDDVSGSYLWCGGCAEYILVSPQLTCKFEENPLLFIRLSNLTTWMWDIVKNYM